MRIFQKGGWSWKSQHGVISQFVLKTEECITLLDISPLPAPVGLASHKTQLFCSPVRRVTVTH